MKTWISDNFPLEKLECQYYNICRYYDPGRCGYSDKCEGYLIIDGNKRAKIRNLLRNSLEDFVAMGSLAYQIQLIIKDGRKK